MFSQTPLLTGMSKTTYSYRAISDCYFELNATPKINSESHYLNQE